MIFQLKPTTMRYVFTSLVALLISFTAIAQKSNSIKMEKRIQAIEDKMAIKNVVDVFSNLADTKEIDKQVLLFTEDGMVQSYSNGNMSSDLRGRQQLYDAFSGFLNNFKTVYHLNGQQTIDELTDSTARTTSYCHVVLVGEQDGKQTVLKMYTIYKDEFVKQNGQWLIKKRISDFVFRETE